MSEKRGRKLSSLKSMPLLNEYGEILFFEGL
jgi:hypothetical protein